MIEAPPLLTTDFILSPNRIKKRVYTKEQAFTRAATIFQEYFLDTSVLNTVLWDHAAILLRPEAIVTRRAANVFAALREHGLVPVSARKVHLTPEQGSAMWHYQSNVMTTGFRALLRDLMCAGPSVYVVLKDTTVRQSASATSHVTYLKGPTFAKKRRRLHLRSLVGPPAANLFSYIHASDDPADFLREMAILFDTPMMIDILSEIRAAQDRTDRAIGCVIDAESYAPKDIYFGRDPAYEAGNCTMRLVGQECTEWQKWLTLIQRAEHLTSYVGGDSYDTRLATIPDGKDQLHRLDDHLIHPEFGTGF